MSAEDDILALSFLDSLEEAGVLHTVFTSLLYWDGGEGAHWLERCAQKKKKCLSLGLRREQNFPHSEVFQLKLFMIRDDGGAFVSGLLWLRTLNNYNSLTP